MTGPSPEQGLSPRDGAGGAGLPHMVEAGLPPVQLGYQTPEQFSIPQGWENIETFELDPMQRGSFLRLALGLHVGIALLMLCVAVLGVWLLGEPLPKYVRLFLLLFLVIYLLIAQTVAAVRRVGIVTKKWSTFRLVIADQGIVMTSFMMDKVTLTAEQIVRIVETWDAFRVELNKGGKRVLVSKRVQNVARLRERLALMRPITQGKGLVGIVATVALAWSGAVLNVAAGYLGLYTGSRVLVAACLVTCVVLTGLRLLIVWRNVGTPLSVRLPILLLLILPAMMAVRLIIPGAMK